MELTICGKNLIRRLPYFWHEYPEIVELMYLLGIECDNINEQQEYVLNDAFIMTMSESRIEEWEKWLDLPPNGTLEDRRLQILSYFAVISKMTRESIQTLVKTLYNGARAQVIFKDSTINIIVKPLPENSNDELDFQRLLNQLKQRKPCHITLHCERWFNTWQDIKDSFETWGQLKTTCKTWQEVYGFIPN